MTDALFAHGFLTDGDIADLISSNAGLARSKLHRTTRICDLQISLEAYAAVLVAIEDHFDIEIDDLVGADCDTLGALMDRLKDRVARSQRPFAGGRTVDPCGRGGIDRQPLADVLAGQAYGDLDGHRFAPGGPADDRQRRPDRQAEVHPV